MSRTPRVLAIVIATVSVLVAAACSASGSPVTPLVEDLVAPRGLTVLDDGSVLVSEVGRGRLLRVGPGGDMEELVSGMPTTLDSGPAGNYPSGLVQALPYGDGYALLVGEFQGDRFARLYVTHGDGEPAAITPPTSLNLPAENRFSNPYDFVEAPGGWLVSDSGRNAVLHVTEDGEVNDFATFDRIQLDGSQGFEDSEVVPTGIAVGPDGAYYVASLTGFPYPDGEASIYRLEDQNLDGDAMDPGETTVHATGFSVATDLAFDEDGSILVTEFSTEMRRLVEEFGIDEAAEVPGRLVRWSDGDISVVAEGLVSPTSVAVHDGQIYVSEEFTGRVSVTE